MYRFGGLSLALSVNIGAFVALVSLQAYYSVVTRGRLREMEARFLQARDDLRKTNQRNEVIETRIVRVEDTITREIEERRDALIEEMRELEQLVGKLGQTFERRLAEGTSQARGTPVHRLQSFAAHAHADHPESLAGLVEEAIIENRLDLSLQPVVNLPQRRACYYEAFTSLRTRDGRTLKPDVYLPVAEREGLVSEIDTGLLFRCVQMVRRLSEKDRRIAVFCNISGHTLKDEDAFPRFHEFARDNRDLATSLVLEITADAFESRTPVMARHMARLGDLGFRFSVDRAQTLRLDLPGMQAEGVRFVKMEGRRLLELINDTRERPRSSISREIAAQDVSALFARYGVDLVADRVEDERTVVELLDYDIGFGQGYVFGHAKPVKDTGQASDELGARMQRKTG